MVSVPDTMQTESLGKDPTADPLPFSIAKLMEPDQRLQARQVQLDSAFKKYVPASVLQHYPVLYYHPAYYLPLANQEPTTHEAKEASESRTPGRHKTFTCTDCGKVTYCRRASSHESAQLRHSYCYEYAPFIVNNLNVPGVMAL